MEQSIQKVKNSLINEFRWLKSHYPLPLFQSIELKIYDFKEYNQFYRSEDQESHKEKETCAFLTEIISNESIEYAIFMVISENFIPDETDLMIMNRNSIKNEDFYCWILYHEYGHLWQLHDTYQSFGLSGLIKEKEIQEDELEQLYTKKRLGRITSKEYENQYRDLNFEKSSDQFADQVYQARKTHLCYYSKNNND